MKTTLLYRILLIAALVTAASPSHASWRTQVRAGDKAFSQEKYDEALVKYLEALGAEGDSALIGFDLGNVYQKQDKFPEAAQQFQSRIASGDSLERADALYNLGNALMGLEKYPEAAQAYKTSLQAQPRRPDALHNLELALRLMERQQQQQQQQNQQNQEQQDQDQKDQDQQQQNQDQQQQDQQQQEQQPDQQAQQDQQQQQEEQQAQQQQQQPMAGQMSREEAERLLNALQMDEKQVQENLHRQQAVEVGVEKDW
ncbi:MAG: tetratricopeptide repeat protein [Candidatus Zixiibacteriota bacterium]|nr:MAG: tetratricopeptide repeat protein [candidate division Zixibacteria bacterium]